MAESLFQITGLASNVDWGKLIDAIIENERKKTRVWESEIERLTLRRGLYQEFQAVMRDLKGKLQPLTSRTTLEGKSVRLDSLTPGVEAQSVVRVTASSTAPNGTYEVEVTSVAAAHKVASRAYGDVSASLNLSGTFRITQGSGSVDVSVSSSDSLLAVANKVNAAASQGGLSLTAYIWEGRLIVESTRTGTASALSFTDSADVQGSTSSSEVLESLGILDDSKAVANQLRAASDAVFTVNGNPVVRQTNRVDDLYVGITFEILSVGRVMAYISDDRDRIKEAISSFVSTYNDAIEWISIRVSEEKVENPKSELERKRGLLRGDSLLWQAKTAMRQRVADPLSGLPPGLDRLSAVGIKTESINYGKSGKLEFDETAFDAAFDRNPEAVRDLIRGAAARLLELVDGYVSSIPVNVGGAVVREGRIPNRIDSIDSTIRDLRKQIASFEYRLEMKKVSLTQRFTRLEEALSQLTKQSQWLAGVIAQMQGGGKG